MGRQKEGKRAKLHVQRMLLVTLLLSGAAGLAAAGLWRELAVYAVIILVVLSEGSINPSLPPS